jgi:ribosomal protein S6--L-glutamate ligase
LRVRLITDKPGHTVLAEVLELLEAEPLSPEADAGAELAQPADLYLLHSRSPAALALAARLEAGGHRVVNSVAATTLCQDRLSMGQRLDEAGIPAPRVLYTGPLQGFAGSSETGVPGDLFPVIVKSRANRRGDLVAAVGSDAELFVVCGSWANEEVIVQEHLPNDGWDIKAWVIGGTVYAARRPTPLDPAAERQTLPIDELPPEWAELIAMVGTAFSLDVFGVDMVLVDGSAVVIDINAFPGFEGVPGAAAALATFARGRYAASSSSWERPRLV